MDALGHVNNAEYFRYIEQARVTWFDAHGLRGSANGCVPVIVRAECNFIKPIIYPATVAIRLYFVRRGGKSITIGHDLRLDADQNVKFADGESVMVWIDHAQGTTAPLPPALLELIE